ncbi:F-box/kelch-repeat protein At3g06240-like [Durio zibethinus]|uniref:F-box/kelch-repeat protein At3g06240-like n=1 Tax=Durio zibethinus TaxID=66656 RepID=A0A6P5X2X2_DURZI|nr:F-box/kelch-repeat protein At3g06240-like [Durio zibethinus]
MDASVCFIAAIRCTMIFGFIHGRVGPENQVPLPSQKIMPIAVLISPFLFYLLLLSASQRQGKFMEVPLPSDSADSFTTVGVLRGCLCWLTCGTGTVAMKQYDFWVMKEYDEEESWTKAVVNIPFLCLRPLSFLKNVEALLEMDGKLVLYNPREGTQCRRKLEIESLVSPTLLWQWELGEICSSDENE